jgi:ribosomal protein S18 acetylase RimI-like enzyme
MPILEDDLTQTESAIIKILESHELEQTGHGKSHTGKYAWSIHVQEKFVGGLTCAIWHQTMHIDLLAIEKAHRKQNLATKLMRKAQDKALESGVTSMTVNTQDFQARGFYEKLGFTVFGQLEDVPYVGTTKYYLIKRL